MNGGNDMQSHDPGARSAPWLRSRVLPALVVLGFLLRLAISMHEGLAKPPVPGSDGSEYDSYAWNLAQGREYSGISPDVKTPDGQLLEHPTVRMPFAACMPPTSSGLVSLRRLDTGTLLCGLLSACWTP